MCVHWCISFFYTRDKFPSKLFCDTRYKFYCINATCIDENVTPFRRWSQIWSDLSLYRGKYLQDERLSTVTRVLRSQSAMEDNGDATIESNAGETTAEIAWLFPTVQRREWIDILELLRGSRTASSVVQGGTRALQQEWVFRFCVSLFNLFRLIYLITLIVVLLIQTLNAFSFFLVCLG